MTDRFADQLESRRLRHLREQFSDGDNRHVVASAAILRSFKILSARVEAELDVLGLNMPRYEVLGLIEASPDGLMSPTELSRATLLHPATMTHTVNALEKRKLIRRRPKPSDKRVLLAEITPLGRKVVKTANRALARIRFGVADLSEDDATEVAIRLSRMHAATDDVIEATA
jgi:DNA-binding MarR family transcriptional regulator